MTVKNEILGTGFRRYDMEKMNAMDTCLRRNDIGKKSLKTFLWVPDQAGQATRRRSGIRKYDR